MPVVKRLDDDFVKKARCVRKVKPSRDGQRQIIQSQETYIDTIERGLALVLIVSYGGTKTFRMLTYVNGKQKSLKLGTYPTMTAAEAEAEARDRFKNPKKYAALDEVGSFKEIAENWFKRHVEARQLRSRDEIKRHLERYVYPKWKDRKFLDIGRSVVSELLDHIEDNHGRSQADAVLATLRAIMTWHQSRDEKYILPIVKGMRRNKDRVSRSRILTENEIRRLWEVTTEINGTFGSLVKVLLLTAQRREKVATMKWDDIANGEWTIRVERREKGTAGTIKLPALALKIIQELPRIAGNPHVFPARGNGPFNSFGQHKQKLDKKLPDMPPWTLHDLRRTARSLLSQAGVRPDISERVLGHAITGVEGVYDRHSYSEQKADALNRLAALIERIVNPPTDNVVPLVRGG